MQNDGLAFGDDKEVFARFSLAHDRLAVLEGNRLQSVRHRQTLELAQVLQNRNLEAEEEEEEEEEEEVEKEEERRKVIQ